MVLERGEREAAVAVGLRIVGSELNCLVEVLERGVVLPEFVERAAAIVVGLGKARLMQDGVVKALSSFLVSLESTEGIAAAGVKLGEVWMVEDGRIGQLDRQFILSGLAGHHAEQIERVGVAGGDLEDLTVECLRLRQSTGAVMRDRFLKLGIER